MEMADIVPVNDLTGNNEAVLVINDELHIVACNRLVSFAQKPGIRIGHGKLRLTTRFKLRKIGLGTRALGHQRRYSRAKITAIAAVIAAAVGSFFGFRRISVFKRLTVSLDLQVQPCDLFGQPLARENALLAGIAVEERAVDRNNTAADKPELANQQYEVAVRRLQRLPVLLAKVGDRSIARPQVLQKPDQLQIAARFPLQPPR